MSTDNLRLLADDLSGALDSAVAFAPGLKDHQAIVSIEFSERAAIACNIGTRDMAVADAARRLEAAIPWLLHSRWPFLKIDSRLRGHVAASTMRLAEGGLPVVIVPSVPSQGRIVRSGRVLSQGEGGDWQVEPIDLRNVSFGIGRDLILSRPGDEVPDGISLWDASTEADLDRIVRAVLAADRRVLLCGASGLAAALARAFGVRPPRIEGAVAPLLMVVGTAHSRTLLQIAAFEAAYPGRHVAIDRDDRLPALLDEPMLVTARIPEGSSGTEIARRIDLMLGKVAAAERPGSLFVTGGATLEALCWHLGAKEIGVTGQFRPGIPAGRLLGGPWNGVSVFSKSGGFAEPDLMTALAASS